MSRGSRIGIIAVLLAAIALNGVTRVVADNMRATNTKIPGSQTELSQMNSFALALLLGGLRGPLVMILWSSSETQKSEKDLEDFDTKVEWIRLLQPEFDTVHLFQIWNKAYNISVQMASLANKYTAILDALDYAQRVDDQRPSNINILTAIAQVYFDKLGGSTEKDYYRDRIRRESKPHEMKQKLRRDDPAWRRLELDPILDDKGNILPQYLQPVRPRPADLPADSDWQDGSALQYLKAFEPFPYGVSPLALAYNYHKRAQVLQTVDHQRHTQLSDMVVDSRPALDLKGWAVEEWERGRRSEIRALMGPGREIPKERGDLELIAADVPANAKDLLPEAMNEAIYSYNRAVELAKASDAEYARHIANYATNAFLYQSHRDDLKGMGLICAADRDFLKALDAQTPAERDKLFESAAQSYADANHQYQLILLQYYSTDNAAAKLFPKGITRTNVANLPRDQVAALLDQVLQYMHATGDGMQNQEDMGEYLRYLERSGRRLHTIASVLKEPATATTTAAH
jgi:hypothetical protein